LVKLPHEHGMLFSTLAYQKDLREFGEEHSSDERTEKTGL